METSAGVGAGAGDDTGTEQVLTAADASVGSGRPPPPISPEGVAE